MRTSNGLLAVAVLSLVSCYPSNVIEEADRSVLEKAPSVAWAVVDQLPTGFYESEELTGEAAGSILQIYYYFGENGHYSGAALVLGELGPTFQVLSGQWKFDNGKLDLQDGSDPVLVRATADRLQLTGDTGSVVLVRVEMK